MAYQANGIQGEYLTYMGKPLVREGNVLIYGDMADDYCLQIMIMNEKETTVGNTKKLVPDTVFVQVLSTDTSKPFAQRLAKQFQKNGLYEALDIGIAWMTKMNAKK